MYCRVLFQLIQVQASFFGAAQIRLTDDFDQGDSTAVVIHQGILSPDNIVTGMHQLPGLFL